MEEIKESISNYSTILKDEKYYYSHRCSLKDFLKKYLELFLSRNNPHENYLKFKKAKPASEQQQTGLDILKNYGNSQSKSTAVVSVAEKKGAIDA